MNNELAALAARIGKTIGLVEETATSLFGDIAQALPRARLMVEIRCVAAPLPAA